MEIKRGVLRAFDSASYRATVQLAGSQATNLDGIAVARNIASSEMVNGRSVCLLFFDAANPADAVLVAVWT